ncbi:hypothetical protein HanRHA438_Chr16g0756001 [Helianthus annuus]|uniref:Uncharacterized protein n=1 Tax=Helianthus annuus TaxID=4232 RepID=A0A9K3DQA8_HELAN|nr:uncharacterized protein LOC110889954 [Helianthus annuus]KAF5759676.1 hypothetical protein HanXRQr2_Chr16g0744171 [Helianthus annuus]KAJ0437838.1 hypothetical protein HanHA300_Chr16g0606841 [Helianthus annuus]KAJ0442403.1 hypothetical protein HanIR_Chr16g0808851 [Helianthus annuus]KAJ0460163.1 hypothetical protein HanHA89_Chr16g0657441 [Helianthus annuus]KAJ0640603.1 hypothetical protein HanLR1_Chr16g0617441 [Helianthus annuus]
MSKSGKKKQPDAIDEVEELLKLTQDDLLLKLTVNSHTSSKFDFVPESSNAIIDPDLDRRFQALRSKPKPKPETAAAHAHVDDLFARFAALKGPNATSTTEHINIEEADEEDEVQKIINWAVDAARLDPSPPSDDDDSDSDDDDKTVAPKKKKKGSKK